METRFLRTFLSVVETGSVAETARRLNISPSAVTQRIQALENEIGDNLLERSGQRMKATSAAKSLMSAAAAILKLEGDVKTLVQAERGTGLLKIGVINSALTGLMPDILLRLRKTHPGIDLYIEPGTSGSLYRRVMDDDLDLALIVKPHFPMPKSLAWISLRTDSLLLITEVGSPVSDIRTLLKREPFIRYDRRHWGGAAVDRYLRREKIRPREQYELDSLEAIVVMVSRGLGVSIIPDWSPPWPEDIRLDRTVLEDAPGREIGVAWPRTTIRLPLINAFLAVVQNC